MTSTKVSLEPANIATPSLHVAHESESVSRQDALKAVRTLLAWIGENPDREGLHETPDRLLRAWEEHFSGYEQDPEALLLKTFSETESYQDMVLLRDIHFVSHCEHHISPIEGVAHVAYLPGHRVVGLSKLARLVDVFAQRLQIQERLTNQIAETLDSATGSRGVAVLIEARHHCMATRGVKKEGACMTTTRFIGAFNDNADLQQRFMRMIGR